MILSLMWILLSVYQVSALTDYAENISHKKCAVVCGGVRWYAVLRGVTQRALQAPSPGT